MLFRSGKTEHTVRSNHSSGTDSRTVKFILALRSGLGNPTVLSINITLH